MKKNKILCHCAIEDMGFFVTIHNLASLDQIHHLSQVAVWSWGWPTVFHVVSLNVFYESRWNHNLIYNLAGKYEKRLWSGIIRQKLWTYVDLVEAKMTGDLMIFSFFPSFGFSISSPFIGAMVPMPWRSSVDFYSAEKLISSFAMYKLSKMYKEVLVFMIYQLLMGIAHLSVPCKRTLLW